MRGNVGGRRRAPAGGAFLLKARELAPADLDNRYKLALVYLRVGQANEAFKEAAEILKQAPDNGPALAILAETSVTPELSQTAEQGSCRNSRTTTIPILKWLPQRWRYERRPGRGRNGTKPRSFPRSEIRAGAHRTGPGIAYQERQRANGPRT